MSAAKINRVSHRSKNKVNLMTASELVELSERVVRLETKIEELGKRLDSMAKYLRELYEYLQKQNQPLL
jgi:two-component sensor histidine kinase